jgi:hypothetical protein
VSRADRRPVRTKSGGVSIWPPSVMIWRTISNRGSFAGNLVARSSLGPFSRCRGDSLDCVGFSPVRDVAF